MGIFIGGKEDEKSYQTNPRRLLTTLSGARMQPEKKNYTKNEPLKKLQRLYHPEAIIQEEQYKSSSENLHSNYKDFTDVDLIDCSGPPEESISPLQRNLALSRVEQSTG